ncbi:MAG: protein phosphatase CheZ [Firmicutes bacterium]|nr:protein phosphatase CheZ [Bacillota bacterium]
MEDTLHSESTSPDSALPSANVQAQDLDAPESLEPGSLVREFQERNENLDARLDSLQSLIQEIRDEIQNNSTKSLSRLASAAEDMANGRVYQRIDMEAKGELGALVKSLNTTLHNLQQLDSSIKEQSTQVPELAAQLDAITADTETATQSVMNRLDTLMNAGEEAGKALKTALAAMEQREAAHLRLQARLDEFMARAAHEDPARVAQEVLDFLFEHQVTTQLPPVDAQSVQAHLTTISDEAFEILNTLQFQDITRQKVEKVVMLLKQFQSGLQRLLHIFKIEGQEDDSGETVFEHRTVATQEHIFETTLETDQNKQSVDDIIAQFKKNQG